MSRWWGDIDARARGLDAHLPGPARLRALAGRGSPAELARDLAAEGILPGGGRVTGAGELDAGIRRWAAGRLALLERRMGSRRAAAARVVLEEEDRRSLRTLLRGAAAGTRPALRHAGLVPTSRLSAPALEELSRASDVADLARALERFGHPAARVLSAASTATVPDLFGLEVALDRAWAARAVDGARRAGPELRSFVREAVDVANAWTALTLCVAPGEVPAAEVFLVGGGRIGPGLLDRAFATGSREEAARVLAPAFRNGPLAPLLTPDLPAAGWERAALGLRAAAWHRRGRTSPLGPAPFLAFSLRLRAAVVDLSRLAWAAALGAPDDVALGGLRRPS
ncbi:MAG TPA: V-type ATPase subunit [Gemmatimonadota bacterium]|nr:V-type ATPase subunit [Gemmatimonadota bacterium]